MRLIASLAATSPIVAVTVTLEPYPAQDRPCGEAMLTFDSASIQAEGKTVG